MINEIIYLLAIGLCLFGGIMAFVLYANTRIQKILLETDKIMESFDENQNIIIKENLLYQVIKRFFDIVFAGIALITLFPLFFIIGILIKMETKESILTKPKMIGKDGKLFTAFKFRTMRETLIDNVGRNQYQNDTRIMRVGKILRIFFIDELPMFISVFKGDLSLVGTSLRREHEIALIPEKIKTIILNSKPGLASLWSISRSNYFDQKTIQKKYNLDIYYTTKRGLFFDSQVLTRAILLIIGNTASY